MTREQRSGAPSGAPFTKEPEGRKPREYDEPLICPVCKGEGTITGEDRVDDICAYCDGEGVIWR